MPQPRACLVLTLTTLLTACATGGDGAPQRPAVAIADEAGVVDSRLVVGTWTCRELNPYPGQPAQTTTTTYNADGTFVGQARSAMEGPVGNMLVTVRGNWRADGQTLVSSGVQMEATAADGNPVTGMLASLSTTLANNLMAGQKEGAAEVLKLTSNELVTQAIGVDEAPTVACTR